MGLISDDTTQEARERQVQAWRRMGGPRRLALALELSDDVKTVALEGLRMRHPDESEAELSQRLVGSQ